MPGTLGRPMHNVELQQYLNTGRKNAVAKQLFGHEGIRTVACEGMQCEWIIRNKLMTRAFEIKRKARVEHYHVLIEKFYRHVEETMEQAQSKEN